VGSLSLWDVHRAWTWAYALDSRWSPVWRDLMIPEDPSSGRLVLPVCWIQGGPAWAWRLGRTRRWRVRRPRRMSRLRSKLDSGRLRARPAPPRSCPTARSWRRQAATRTDRYRGTGHPQVPRTQGARRRIRSRPTSGSEPHAGPSHRPSGKGIGDRSADPRANARCGSTNWRWTPKGRLWLN